MRHHVLVLGCVVAAAACSKPDSNPADSPAAATPAAETPAGAMAAPVRMSDVAGTWNFVGKNEAGDSTLVTYVFTATADSSGWSIKFPDMATAVPVRVVAVEGDSVVTDAGPFPSQLRKGVQVRTHSVMRLQNGTLVGMTTARYSVSTADSVRRVRMEGTRAP